MEKATIFKNINYKVSSQSKWTFDIPPIRDFLRNYLKSTEQVVYNVFAGKNKLGGILFPLTEDNEEEALKYLKTKEDNSADVVILDPPYAKNYKKLYGCAKISDYNKWYWDVKKEAARVTRVGGVVIQIGYETNGIGAIKGFEKEELLIVAHGGLLRDTFCYSERKIENGKHYKTWLQR